MITLTPCPSCGALLSPATVAAIADPRQPESCPKAATPIVPPELTEGELASRRLVAFAMLGSIAERRTAAA